MMEVNVVSITGYLSYQNLQCESAGIYDPLNYQSRVNNPEELII
jgi:hypothetical protein